jgi:tRNA synthetases class I (E and Q), anti-codon binding domain.
LKNLCNVSVKGKKLSFSGMAPQKGSKILQWCSAHTPIELVYPDGKIVSGIVEDNISELDDETVQFERVGFVRLEGKKAFFLHR